MKTKQELEQSIVMLEDALKSGKTHVATYQEDLDVAKKQLANVNKPVITEAQLDDITEAVEMAVGNFDFSDEDNYDKDFNIDYDNRIQLENFEFTNAQELIEEIIEEVHKLFVEAEELDTTEADNHAPIGTPLASAYSKPVME